MFVVFVSVLATRPMWVAATVEEIESLLSVSVSGTASVKNKGVSFVLFLFCEGDSCSIYHVLKCISAVMDTAWFVELLYWWCLIEKHWEMISVPTLILVIVTVIVFKQNLHYDVSRDNLCQKQTLIIVDCTCVGYLQFKKTVVEDVFVPVFDG